MRPHQPTLGKLIREAEEARLEEVALISRGKEVLDHARAIARTIVERVRCVTIPERKRPDAHPDLSPNQAEDERPAKSSLAAPTVSFGERPMLDYQADAGEPATACEPNDSVCVPQHTTGIRQDECSNWENYALFAFEQQGRYCQLV